MYLVFCATCLAKIHDFLFFILFKEMRYHFQNWNVHCVPKYEKSANLLWKGGLLWKERKYLNIFKLCLWYGSVKVQLLIKILLYWTIYFILRPVLCTLSRGSSDLKRGVCSGWGKGLGNRGQRLHSFCTEVRFDPQHQQHQHCTTWIY